MPRIKDVDTLEDLCVMNIAERFDDVCKEHTDSQLQGYWLYPPALQLPVMTLVKITRALRELKKYKRWHIPYLIQGSEKSICLTGPEHIYLRGIFYFLNNRCRALEILQMSVHYQQDFEMLSSSVPFCLPSFKQLLKLKLQFIDIKETTIVVIATHCERLRILDLSGTSATDNGLISLLEGDIFHALKTVSVMPSLVHNTLEYLDVTLTSASLWCIMELSKLPKLKCLISDRLIIKKRDRSSPGISPRVISCIRYSGIKMIFDDNRLHVEDFVQRMNLVFDNEYNEIAVKSTFSKVLPRFHEVDDSKLSLICLDILRIDSFGTLRPILSTFGPNLVCIKLYCYTNIGLDIIGSTCPRLKELCLIECTLSMGVIPQQCFLELRNAKFFLELKQRRLIPGIRHITTDNLEVLASLPKLEGLSFSNTRDLNDHSFSQVLNVTSFPTLESLEFSQCKGISIETIKRFIALPNPLKKIGIYNSSKLCEALCYVLMCCVKYHNLDVKIIWKPV